MDDNESRLLAMSAEELRNAYAKFGSFSKCAEAMGISRNEFRKYWYRAGNSKPESKRHPISELSAEEMIEIYRKAGSFERAAKDRNTTVETFKKYWYRLGLPNPRNLKKSSVKGEHIHCCRCDTNTDKNEYKIAVISDLHFGSNFHEEDKFRKFIKECNRRNINTLICCGDMIEGLMKRQGHEQERFLHTVDDIMDYAIENYPDGFDTNIIINGNHENSLKERGDGFNFVKNFIKHRKDVIGSDDVSLIPSIFEIDGGIRVAVHHGHGTCSRNLVNRTRDITIKMSEHRTDWDILLCGHCHRFSSDYWMGKYAFSIGTFQGITPFLASKMLIPHIGGLFIQYTIDEDTAELKSVKNEFYMI